jgi:hypothetical protein
MRRLQVQGGGWRIEDGKWQMADGKGQNEFERAEKTLVDDGPTGRLLEVWRDGVMGLRAVGELSLARSESGP